MIRAKAMRCPRCLSTVPWDRAEVARGSFRCPHCAALLVMSRTFARILLVPCIVAGFAVVRQHGVWSLLRPSSGCGMAIAALGIIFGVAFLTLMVLVRVVPYLLSVPLELDGEAFMTTLGLGGAPKRGEETKPCDSREQNAHS